MNLSFRSLLPWASSRILHDPHSWTPPYVFFPLVLDRPEVSFAIELGPLAAPRATRFRRVPSLELGVAVDPTWKELLILVD